MENEQESLSVPSRTAPEPEPEEEEGKVSQKLNIFARRNIIVACIVLFILLVGGLAWFNKGLLFAAVVNGVPISRLSVIEQLEKASGKNALDTIINKKLINDEAAKRGITVSDAEVTAEMKNIEGQITAQGGTLAQALAMQGLTQDEFKAQIVLQKKLEKMLADQLQVSDAEIQQFIKDNNVTIPKGQEAAYNEQVKQQIYQQKLNSAAGTFVDSLKAQAKIQYFVNY
jgi:foldase protein PrsA